MDSTRDGPGDAIDVSIVLVSYRTPDLLDRCLRSIRKSTTGVRYEVIAVENGSGDESPEVLRRHPWVRSVMLPANTGFARAANRGAEEARGDFLLFVNPDTELASDPITKLVTCARAKPEHGIYGGRVLRPDGSVDLRTCGGRPSLWAHTSFGLGLNWIFPGSEWLNPRNLGRWPRDAERCVEVITCCFFLIRHDLWRKLDGFDARFFMYSEDVDLCLRAAALGARPLFTPDATVVHVGGASSTSPAAKLELVLTGEAELLRKHSSRVAQGWGLLALTCGVALRGLLAAAGVVRDGRAWQAAWHARRRWRRGYDATHRDR